ncbi:MAG TPA: carboxymuconolactone decarboxylase family protein, partial [Solirubrobacterales bacterium]|nr:carboxymuconolactone decarboxylase family protein [Solirubrobacterales bacterium]
MAEPSNPDEARAYLAEMTARRGYVLDYHRAIVHADLPFARAANELIEAAYLAERRLDRRTKELIFIVSLTVMRADRAQIVSHIKVALELGVTPEEILEAIEISFP